MRPRPQPEAENSAAAENGPDPAADVVEQSQESAQDQESKQGKDTSWKTILAVLIAVVAIVVAVNIFTSGSGNVTASTVKLDGLYNVELGTGVKIGMKKSVIDKAIGTPTQAYGEYFYDSYLYITYADGKAASLYIEYPNERWITKGGVTIGTSADDLVATLGSAGSIEHDDKWWYYSYDGTICGFKIATYGVSAIYIYDPDVIASDESD